MTSSFIDILNERIIRAAERDAANAVGRLKVSIGDALDGAGVYGGAKGVEDVVDLLVHAATPYIKENCLQLRTEASATAVVGFRR